MSAWSLFAVCQPHQQMKIRMLINTALCVRMLCFDWNHAFSVRLEVLEDNGSLSAMAPKTSSGLLSWSEPSSPWSFFRRWTRSSFLGPHPHSAGRSTSFSVATVVKEGKEDVSARIHLTTGAGEGVLERL